MEQFESCPESTGRFVIKCLVYKSLEGMRHILYKY